MLSYLEVRRFILILSLLVFLAFATSTTLQALSPSDPSSIKEGPASESIFRGASVTSPWQQLLLRAREKGWKGHLTGERAGVRTEQDQTVLWRKFKKGTGTPAFPPNGPSRHLEDNVRSKGDWYQAVDVTKPSQLVAVASSLGVSLHQPYASTEPWHIEAREAFSVPVVAASVFQEGQVPTKSFALSGAFLVVFALLSVFLAFLGSPQARSLILMLLPLGIFTLLLQSALLAIACALVALLVAPFLVRASSAEKRVVYKIRRPAKKEESDSLSGDISWDWPKL